MNDILSVINLYGRVIRTEVPMKHLINEIGGFEGIYDEIVANKFEELYNVYLECYTSDECVNIRYHLSGRRFNNSLLRIKFYNENNFKNLLFLEKLKMKNL